MAETGTPSIGLHGVLVDVLGVGVVMLGPSGIGKSECALELIMRGHRLVADDLIRVVPDDQGDLFGVAAEISGHSMEVKGLGLISIEKLFGVAAIRDRKRIELVIEFVGPDEPINDHLGMSEETYSIGGVPVPYKKVPVRPGRNLAVIVEVAARDHLLKKRGYHTAKEFERDLLEKLKGEG